MLDDRLREQLRQRYSPDGSDLRKLQNRLLDMLVWFDSYCKSRGLTYWLSSGTCLGAVRHGGFIPWDDDVDVEMMQEDYDRLCDDFCGGGDYVLQTPENDTYCVLGYAKLRDLHSIMSESFGNDVNYSHHGCFIDIFPVGHNNAPRFVYQRLKQHVIWLKKLARRRNPGPVGTFLFKMFKSLHLRMVRSVWKKDYQDRNGTARYSAGTVFYKEVYRWSDLCETVDMEFEGHLLPVPRGYDTYLKTLYGDYGTLPEERVRNVSHFTSFELVD